MTNNNIHSINLHATSPYSTTATGCFTGIIAPRQKVQTFCADKKNTHWDVEKAQEKMNLFSQPGNLSLIPRAYPRKKKTSSPKGSSNLGMHMLMYMYVYTNTNKQTGNK